MALKNIVSGLYTTQRTWCACGVEEANAIKIMLILIKFVY